ncbi:MAG: diphthamide biosynthesis enzyme Dph2 [Thermoprotei archaeon]|nr:MAG: diphthamide biosynthesis enzyme Dph2 [Thermoprotei archaeon]
MLNQKNLLYELEFSRIRSFITNYNPRKILIQIADGLKFLSRYIIDYIESLDKDIETYLSASPSYGACDIPVDEVKALNADAIIHVGHNPYPYMGYSINIPVLYIEAFYTGDITEKLIKSIIDVLGKYRDQDIVLLASIQYIKLLDKLYNILKAHGYRVKIPRSNVEPLLRGQVLGCVYSTVKNTGSNTYLILTSGLFHGIGVCLTKPSAKVFVADIIREEVIDIGNICRKILAKRYYIVSNLINNGFKTATLIVGSRPGQYRPWLIDMLYKRLIVNDVKVYKAIVSYLDKDRLIALDQALGSDIYIVTSCPRLPIDDLSDFYKPLLTPGEALMVLNESMEYRYPW